MLYAMLSMLLALYLAKGLYVFYFGSPIILRPSDLHLCIADRL
jgi:hypothetical protein